MAKLDYTKPLFNICPIPLAIGGTNCAYKTQSQEYICAAVYDKETKDTIFLEEMDACIVKAQDNEICYGPPIANENVFTS